MSTQRTRVEKYMGVLAVIVIGTVIGIGIAFMINGWIVDAQNDEQIIIEDKIINVEYIERSKYYVNGDTLNITFENGDSYIIESYETVDFTVNSRMIVILWRDDASHNWIIERMYKVPD